MPVRIISIVAHVPTTENVFFFFTFFLTILLVFIINSLDVERWTRKRMADDGFNGIENSQTDGYTRGHDNAIGTRIVYG